MNVRKKNQFSLNIIVAFRDCQIIIFIHKLFHGKKYFVLLPLPHTFSSDFKMLFIFHPSSAEVFDARFCINRLYRFLFKVVFCRLVGRLGGRKIEGKCISNTNTYYNDFLISAIVWTSNSHQAEIEKLFSMLLFQKKNKKNKKKMKETKIEEVLLYFLKCYIFAIQIVVFRNIAIAWQHSIAQRYVFNSRYSCPSALYRHKSRKNIYYFFLHTGTPYHLLLTVRIWSLKHLQKKREKKMKPKMVFRGKCKTF